MGATRSALKKVTHKQLTQNPADRPAVNNGWLSSPPWFLTIRWPHYHTPGLSWRCHNCTRFTGSLSHFRPLSMSPPWFWSIDPAQIPARSSFTNPLLTSIDITTVTLVNQPAKYALTKDQTHQQHPTPATTDLQTSLIHTGPIFTIKYVQDAKFDYSRPTNIAQKLGLLYTWALWKKIRNSWVTLYMK